MPAKHKFPALHPWRIDVRRARQIQEELRGRVLARDELAELRTVAGVDVGFEQGGAVARAAVAVLDYPSLRTAETAVARRRNAFPYVPGYLSFREVPPILAALAKLDRLPDLILCDGQGVAHPRRFGLACHLGVVTAIPTVGVAKTRLIGQHGEVGSAKGSRAPLMDAGEKVGVALRTRTGTKPVFVSVGHKVCLATAIEVTLRCCPRYRLPETTRAAHRLASGGRTPRPPGRGVR